MRKLQNTKQEEEMKATVKEDEEGIRGAVQVRRRWRYRKTAKQMICFVVCAKMQMKLDIGKSRSE